MLTRSVIRVVIMPSLAVVLGIGLVACGTSTDTGSMPGMNHGAEPSSMGSSSMGMPGMDDMPAGNGLAATASGLTFAPSTTSLPAGRPASFTFQIRAADGKPITSFAEDQTKLMHFYLIRSDLTGFQHVHPTMASDGTWTAQLQTLQPGSWRAYASFIAIDSTGRQTPIVVGDKLTVTGSASSAPLPPAATTTQVDGYTLSVAGEDVMANMTHTITVTVRKGGVPVTDLQPYLDTYAHLTAFHEGDLAFTHLHPQGMVDGDHGGPTLSFAAMLPKPGNWRLFLQFQTGGTLHTAALTLAVN